MKNLTDFYRQRTLKGLKGLLIGLALVHSLSFAQNPKELFKTTNGCAVYASSTSAKAERVWTGECVNGLAEGPGELQTTTSFRQTERTKMHLGIPFGFSKVQTVFSASELSNWPWPSLTWTFRYGNRQVVFGSLGLAGNDSLLENRDGVLPARTVGVGGLYHTLNDGKTGSLVFYKNGCGGYVSQFPECGFAEGKQNYDIYLYAYRAAGTDIKSPSTYTFCPQPRNLSSCSQIEPQLTEALIRSVEQFIQESMPSVRALEGEMRTALAARDQEKASAAAAVAREQASANAAFESKLNKGGVGELFAMADEYKSKGDINRTRITLRKLMERFPDHKLAVQAANMLGDLQGK